MTDSQGVSSLRGTGCRSKPEIRRGEGRKGRPGQNFLPDFLPLVRERTEVRAKKGNLI